MRNRSAPGAVVVPMLMYEDVAAAIVWLRKGRQRPRGLLRLPPSKPDGGSRSLAPGLQRRFQAATRVGIASPARRLDRRSPFA